MRACRKVYFIPSARTSGKMDRNQARNSCVILVSLSDVTQSCQRNWAVAATRGGAAETGQRGRLGGDPDAESGFHREGGKWKKRQ